MARKLSPALLAVSLMVMPAGGALACSSEPYIGSICTVGFNFCPRGWAKAQGQILSIAQNTALFSLLGTMYGGNGQTTFALPDLRGRSAVGTGAGSGLSDVVEGETLGQESVTLLSTQMPAHSHSASTSVVNTSKLRASSAAGNTDSPLGAVPSKQSRTNIYNSGAADVDMGATALSSNITATTSIGIAGGSQPVPIRSPGLGLTHCIALQGIFPPRD